ncbi:MAG: hypothetical protein ACLFVP_08725 [Candidatus Bathyarchaeia archaeon]
MISRIREPVKRKGATKYLRLTLLSFASSVIFVRSFLVATGYPQLGTSELHIAHVLLGGALLFTAALLPLIYANRWVYTWNSVLAGVGVGLFIDEVGKFITRNNDYFHPAAAPVIYASFLLVSLITIQVSRGQPRKTRSRFYQILEDLQEVLDRDLNPQEQRQIEDDLRWISDSAENPDLIILAERLLEFLEHESIHIVKEKEDLAEKIRIRLRNLEKALIKPGLLMSFNVIGMASIGVFSAFKLPVLLRALENPSILEDLIKDLVARGYVLSGTMKFWAMAQLSLEVSMGFLLILASALLVFNKKELGLEVGRIGLLVYLTIVDVLLFYISQFSTLLNAVIQLMVYLGVSYYRSNFLD